VFIVEGDAVITEDRQPLGAPITASESGSGAQSPERVEARPLQRFPHSVRGVLEDARD
jgi:hypothetical protein